MARQLANKIEYLRNVPFSSKLCESSIILLPDAASKLAISRAASNLRRERKPLFVRTASPMSMADSASPCARTIIDYCEGINNTLTQGNEIHEPVFLESLGPLGTLLSGRFVAQPIERIF